MRMRYKIILVALLLCGASSASADSWTVSLLPPNGAVSGVPGTTVGWGYTISNQSTTNWLVLGGLSADVFQHGTPSAIFDFPIVAPNSTVALTFDPVSLLGLYALTWDPTAPVGFVNSGMFILSAEWWDGDPLAGANFLSFATDQSTAYSATVAPVPEPATFSLLSVGLFAVARRRWRALR